MNIKQQEELFQIYFFFFFYFWYPVHYEYPIYYTCHRQKKLKYKQELNDTVLIGKLELISCTKKKKGISSTWYFLTSVKWIFIECCKIKLQYTTT